MNQRLMIILGVALTTAAVVGGGWYYYDVQAAKADPRGFVSSNGRMEAAEVDVATKAAGRITEILVEEGQIVERGALIARMDTSETEAALRALEAQARQASQGRDEAGHVVEQRQGALDLAEKDLERTESLFQRGNVAEQKLDQMRTARATASSALAAAQSGLAAAESGIRAVGADADRLRGMVADGELTAPREGRVLFRLAEAGEVLGAGGKVLTLLDLSNIYMTVFLPAGTVGKIAIGAEARLIVEPLPDRAIPGEVSFISSRAQFTPKQVETESERDRMMFRVKVRVPPDLVRSHMDQAKTGVTGVAYFRVDPDAKWPENLESDLTRTAAK